MRNIVALMPMKGISERVPNKNMKLFNGKPLYHYVLNSLLKSKYINLIVINTDSEILKSDIIKNFKKNVLVTDRHQNLIGNYISMNDVLKQDIENIDADIYIQTHSTNPLLKIETIDDAIKKKIEFEEKNSSFDSIFSVTKTQKRFYSSNRKPMNHDPKMLVTQHLEPIYEENSCFYIFTKNSFFNNDSRIGINPSMYEIDKIEATDIDEVEDFIIAEALYKLLR